MRVMKRTIRKKTLDALGSYHNTTPIIPGVRDPVRAFYKSFKGCGQSCKTRSGIGFRSCNKAVCYVCSKRWAKNQTRRYVAEFQEHELVHDQFRMITLGIGMYETVEECFSAFAAFRDKVRSSLDRKRTRKKASSKAEAWKQFTIIGSLEIDLFRLDQFDDLGSEKKDSYTIEYGFDKSTWKSDSIWVVTFHGIVYLGEITEEDVSKFLQPYTKRVHFKHISVRGSLGEEIQNVLGYSSKTLYEIKLKDGKPYPWHPDNIKEYVVAASKLRGRQPFKFYKSRKE
ncbi:MAG: hypothetical protein ACRYGP_22175 [Janthinobacterium lividum]